MNRLDTGRCITELITNRIGAGQTAGIGYCIRADVDECVERIDELLKFTLISARVWSSDP